MNFQVNNQAKLAVDRLVCVKINNANNFQHQYNNPARASFQYPYAHAELGAVLRLVCLKKATLFFELLAHL